MNGIFSIVLFFPRSILDMSKNAMRSMSMLLMSATKAKGSNYFCKNRRSIPRFFFLSKRSFHRNTSTDSSLNAEKWFCVFESLTTYILCSRVCQFIYYLNVFLFFGIHLLAFAKPVLFSFL